MIEVRREKGGRWRFGVYWSWHGGWILGTVSIPYVGLTGLVIGPLRFAMMRPIYRTVTRLRPVHVLTPA